jgi:hypothetical protein
LINPNLTGVPLAGCGVPSDELLDAVVEAAVELDPDDPEDAGVDDDELLLRPMASGRPR